ncbi:hypothetical protein TRICI_000683 [Trichomonascus ciferrii]|uniref:Uncharacterized protein n=1 Tax=Trichomonascus ciferrii TaxID=44093 RepID=A0A642VBL7_9ASCO|nr:hypothetical protein TRICI_000683 [Trichomonascus ciferrii]
MVERRSSEAPVDLTHDTYKSGSDLWLGSLVSQAFSELLGDTEAMDHLALLGSVSAASKIGVGHQIQRFLNAPSGKKTGARNTLVTMIRAFYQQRKRKAAPSTAEAPAKEPRLGELTYDISEIRKLAEVRTSLKAQFLNDAIESNGDWQMVVNEFFGHPSVQLIGPTTEVVALLFEFLLSKTPAPYKDQVRKEKAVAISSNFESLEQFRRFVAPKCPSASSHPLHHDILYRARFDPHYKTFAVHLIDVTAQLFDPVWMLKFSEQYDKYLKWKKPLTMGLSDSCTPIALYEYLMRVVTAMIPIPVLQWMRKQEESGITTFAQYKTMMEEFDRDPPFPLDMLKDTMGYPSDHEYSLHGLRPVSVHPSTRVDRGVDPFVANPLLLQFPRMPIHLCFPLPYVCRPRHARETVFNNLAKHYRRRSNASSSGPLACNQPKENQGPFQGSSQGKNKDSSS